MRSNLVLFVLVNQNFIGDKDEDDDEGGRNWKMKNPIDTLLGDRLIMMCFSINRVYFLSNPLKFQIRVPISIFREKGAHK